MKVISRMVAKMPIYKNSTRIRYEVELIVEDGIYTVVRHQFISNKLYKSQLIAVTKDKQTAIDKFNNQMLTLTSFL